MTAAQRDQLTNDDTGVWAVTCDEGESYVLNLDARTIDDGGTTFRLLDVPDITVGEDSVVGAETPAESLASIVLGRVVTIESQPA